MVRIHSSTPRTKYSHDDIFFIYFFNRNSGSNGSGNNCYAKLVYSGTTLYLRTYKADNGQTSSTTLATGISAATASTSSLQILPDGSIYLYYGSSKQSYALASAQASPTSFSPLTVSPTYASPTITITTSSSHSYSNGGVLGMRFEPITSCSIGSSGAAGLVNGVTLTSTSTTTFTVKQSSALSSNSYAVCILFSIGGIYEFYLQSGSDYLDVR